MRACQLPTRVRAALSGRLHSRVAVWSGRVAQVLANQLQASHAVPHRELALRMARAVGMGQSQQTALGDIVDLLQTAIDLADNLADREEDVAAGRAQARSYPGVPSAALYCLPALLVGTAAAILYETFGRPKYQVDRAWGRLLETLGQMTVGQGLPTGHRRHLDLVSGQQGVLLCLPFWLVSHRPPWDRRLRVIERWAFLYGRTWEYHQRLLESGTSLAARDFDRAVARARAAWPEFEPFGTEDLSARALIPAGLC